jgi:hypothetical protein
MKNRNKKHRRKLRPRSLMAQAVEAAAMRRIGLRHAVTAGPDYVALLHSTTRSHTDSAGRWRK